MATIKVNVNGINSSVKPPLSKSITSLDSAKSIISSISIPSDFTYASSLKGTITTIGSSKTKINNINTWAAEAVQKFKQAEEKNSNVVSSILSSKITSNVKKSNATIAKTNKKIDTTTIALQATSDYSSNILKTGATIDIDCISIAINETETNIEETKANKSSAFSTIVSKIDEKAKTLANNIEKITTNAKIGLNTVGTKIASTCENAFKTVVEGAKSLGAKAIQATKSVVADAGNVVVSVIKGLCEFVESIFDALTIIVTGAFSIVTGLTDGITYLESMATGTTDEWKSITAEMWKGTMSFVAEDFVGNVFESFYESTAVGQWLDENAHEPFKSDGIVSQVAEGIGYVAGVVLLSIATLGVGTAATGVAASASAMTTASAAIATSAGLGKYTAEYWENAKVSSWENIEEMYKNGEINEEDYQAMQEIRNLTDDEWAEIEEMYENGEISEEQYQNMLSIREMSDEWTTMENLKNGLIYGVANGAWEGVQWYVGGKLGSWCIEGASKLATSSVRVGVDTIFNGMDTFFRTGVDAFTSDKTLIEAWQAQGGWSSVISNVAIGLIGSVGGEIFDNFHNRNNQSINEKEILSKVEEIRKKLGIEDGKAIEKSEEEILKMAKKEGLIELIGGEKIYQIFDTDTVENIEISLITNKKVHNLSSGNDIDVLNGLLNNEIIGDMYSFYTLESEYIFQLPDEEKRKLLKSFAGENANENAIEAMKILWDNKIETTGFEANKNMRYQYVMVKDVDVEDEAIRELFNKIYSQDDIHVYVASYDASTNTCKFNLYCEDKKLWDYIINNSDIDTSNNIKDLFNDISISDGLWKSGFGMDLKEWIKQYSAQK